MKALTWVNPQPPAEFRILHWGLLARRFLEIVKTAKVNDLGHHSWTIQLSGIDLASIYKRNLVDQLDGYPETVKEMCAHWDRVGLTGISGLTKCSDYPMTEEQIIDALGRINTHLDEFESNKAKGNL